jgi:hypothetical protein
MNSDTPIKQCIHGTENKGTQYIYSYISFGILQIQGIGSLLTTRELESSTSKYFSLLPIKKFADFRWNTKHNSRSTLPQTYATSTRTSVLR